MFNTFVLFKFVGKDILFSCIGNVTCVSSLQLGIHVIK